MNMLSNKMLYNATAVPVKRRSTASLAPAPRTVNGQAGPPGVNATGHVALAPPSESRQYLFLQVDKVPAVIVPNHQRFRTVT